MSDSLQQRLDNLLGKAAELTKRYHALQAEKSKADERIDDLKRTVEQQQREISRLNQRIEHLTVVTTLSPRREDVEQSRAILSDLVREIDKCINELNQ